MAFDEWVLENIDWILSLGIFGTLTVYYAQRAHKMSERLQSPYLTMDFDWDGQRIIEENGEEFLLVGYRVEIDNSGGIARELKGYYKIVDSFEKTHMGEMELMASIEYCDKDGNGGCFYFSINVKKDDVGTYPTDRNEIRFVAYKIECDGVDGEIYCFSNILKHEKGSFIEIDGGRTKYKKKLFSRYGKTTFESFDKKIKAAK